MADITSKADSVMADRTLIVQGICATCTEELVQLYFENSKRSGGGDICSVSMSDLNHQATVIFEEDGGKN